MQRLGGISFSSASAPVLRPMPDMEDFNEFFRGTVHYDAGRNDKLTSSFHLAGSAKARKFRQLVNAVDNRLSGIPGKSGIVLVDVVKSCFKLVGGFGCPPNQPHE
jgi:hypothetical protein